MVLGAAFLNLAGPTNPLGAQGLVRDTLPADTIIPVRLPPLEVRILLSPLQLRESPHAVSILRRVEEPGREPGVFLAGTLRALPGLQIQNRFNFAVGERVAVRGLGGRAQFGVRGLQVLVDDVPATLPDGQSTLDHLDLPGLGQVELLRGPASALYGNGAGAVLRFQTRDPSHRPVEEEATVTAGSHGLVQATSVTSGRWGRTGYLLSLGSVNYDGYRDHPRSPGEVFGSAERRTLNTQIQREVAGGRARATVNVVTLDAQNPGSISRSLLDARSRGAADFNVLQKTGKDLTQTQVGLSWAGEVRDRQATLSGFGLSRDVWNRIPPSIVDLDRKAAGFRGLLQDDVATGALDLRWTAGLEVASQWDHRKNLQNQEGTAGAATLDQREEVWGTGVFAQAHLRFSSRMNLMLGVRYDRTRFRAEDRFIEPGNPDDSGTRIMDAVSPSAAISVQLPGGLIARGSLSSFFQTPTTTELSNQPSGAGGFNPSLNPQRGVTMEAGVLAFWKGRIQAEATHFYTRLEDELVPFEVPDAPGRVYFRNAGRSRYEGWELSGRAVLDGGFRLRVAYTFLDARFRDFQLGVTDLSGMRVPGTARRSFQGLLAWEGTPFPRGPRASAEVVLRHQGSIFVDDANTDRAPPHTILDLRVGLREIGMGSLRLAPFAGITNLFDRYYVTAVSVNAFGGRFFDPGPPRAFLLGLTATFGMTP
jgi:iron complex outermembrane receptor protein